MKKTWKSMQNRCSKKVCKNAEKGEDMEPKWEPKSIKNPLKILEKRHQKKPEKTWTKWKKTENVDFRDFRFSFATGGAGRKIENRENYVFMFFSCFFSRFFMFCSCFFMFFHVFSLLYFFVNCRQPAGVRGNDVKLPTEFAPAKY